MSGDRKLDESQADDLDVPRDESEQVTGGVAAGDVTGDGPAVVGDPDRPIVAGRLPGLHKVTDVTLKRG
jgi:hypothetical protein